MATPDPRGRAMLRAYRSATKRSGEQREALWSRIEESLDAGATGPSVEPGSSIEPRPSVEPRAVHGGGWALPVVVAAVAVAAAVVAVISLGPGERRDAAPQPAPWAAPHEAAPREAVEAPKAMPGEPGAETATASRSAAATEPTGETARASKPPAGSSPRDVEPGRDAASSRSAASEPAVDADASSRRSDAPDPRDPVSSSSPTEVDELRAELALIREARQALKADRPAGALEVLDAHARAFPAGQMQEDRAVLRIEALCAAGKAPQARAEVRLFLRAFPGSAHAARVRTTCAEP